MSQNKDNSQFFMTDLKQQSFSFETNKDISYIQSVKKRKRKSLALNDFYYNDSQLQNKDVGENDKSGIQFQGIETALQLRDQLPTNQNSLYLKCNSQDIMNDTSSNEIDLFQKTSHRITHHTDLPPLRIQIKQSMKQDSSDQKSTNIQSSPSPGLKRWRKLSLFMKSIQAFQKSEIKQVNPGEIEEEIKNSPSPRKKQDESKVFNYEQDFEMGQILDNFRRVEELCLLCQSGSPLDLDRIKDILQSDPKKYIRSPEDPEHLVNKLNSQGLFPLYIACLNQNTDIVAFLLKMGAAPNIKTKVSARWRYTNIVEMLLKYAHKFETKDLQISKKQCQSHPQITEMLNKLIFQRSNNIFKHCFPCFF